MTGLREQALRAGHEAALGFAIEAADEAQAELEHTRRVLALILRDHGPVPMPTVEEIEALGERDGIAVSDVDGVLMMRFERDTLEQMQEQFDGEPPSDPDETITP